MVPHGWEGANFLFSEGQSKTLSWANPTVLLTPCVVKEMSFQRVNEKLYAFWSVCASMNGRICIVQPVLQPASAIPGRKVEAGNMFCVGKTPARGEVVVGREPELLQVVGALGTAGRLARRLHRRQEQADQDRDDRDDHQQFDQRETATCAHYRTPARIKDDRSEEAGWAGARPRGEDVRIRTSQSHRIGNGS